MNTAIMITLIICGTLLGIVLVAFLFEKNRTNKPISKEEVEVAGMIIDKIGDTFFESVKNIDEVACKDFDGLFDKEEEK